MTVVDLLAPSLGAAFAEHERQRLSLLAARLPHPRQGGFEIRLARDQPQVDLQINLQRHDGEGAAWLERFLSTPAASTWDSTDAGAGLHRFLSAWAAGDAATDEIDELWLEFDPAEHDEALPSVFLGFPQVWGARARVRALIADWLPRLGKRHQDDLAVCDRCVAALPGGAFVSHLGLMLSRVAQPIRINVKRLFPDRMRAYLHAVGWSGDVTVLTDLLQRPQGLEGARTTLCIDVMDGSVTPSLAVEVSFVAQQPTPWRQLVERLASLGTVDLAKATALLQWPGWTTPATQPNGWPFVLLKEGLLLSSDRLIGIERRISHVKLSPKAGGRIDAKAYAWFAAGSLAASPQEAADEPMPFEAWAPEGVQRATAEMSLDFFTRTTQATFDHFGETFQGWLIDAQGDTTASNRTLAARAGVRDGMRVLDAGCGVGGPAIDIAGRWQVEVHAVTNVPCQVEIGRRLVADAGLPRQVYLTLADFHDLPFAVATFDLVLYLESSTSTDDVPRLLGEAYRVLKPGGRVYLKSMFSPPPSQLTDQQKLEMAEANRSQAGTAPTVAEVVDALEAAGFSEIATEHLSHRANGDRWHEALRATGPRSEHSSLGTVFAMRAARSHWVCADIRAVRP